MKATNESVQATDQATETKIYSAEDFKDGNKIVGVDKKGNPAHYILLSDGSIAQVREGKGKDAERAAIESNGDSSKYMSSMMAACTKIRDKGVSMYDLAELRLKDYTAIQVSFAELNF